MTLSSQLTVFIVEDHPGILQKVIGLVSTLPTLKVIGTSNNVKDSVAFINAKHPQLLLLDINLDDGTAFDILEQSDIATSKVIFITAFQEHAIKAIKYGALDYILKPIDATELNKALEKALTIHPDYEEQLSIVQQQYKEGFSKRIVLSSHQYLHIVQIADIMYCHSDSGYTKIYIADSRIITMPTNIKEYEELLPPSLFIRTHQSFLVNLSYIDKYDKDGFIILKNGAEVPVSSRKKDKVVAHLKSIF